MAYKDNDFDSDWVFTRSFKSANNAEVTRNLISKVKDMRLNFDDHDIYSKLFMDVFFLSLKNFLFDFFKMLSQFISSPF